MADINNLREAQKKEQKNSINNEDINRFKHTPSGNEESLLSFKAQEHEYYPKSILWYVVAGIFAALSIAYFISDQSFSSAIAFALIFSVTLLYGNNPPRIIEVHFTHEGIYIQKTFYEYRKMNSFWIINSPKNNIHSLHFDIGKKIVQTMTIQLHDIHDSIIRSVLQDRVEENFEKEEPSHHQVRRFLGL